MASGPEINFTNDYNHLSSCSVGLSCNFNDSYLLHEENILGSFGTYKYSQPLFHQYHKNDPTVFQNSHCACNQPLSYEMNLILPNHPQQWNSSNIPENSMCYQSFDNVLSMVHETGFSGNKNAVSYIPSGTEFIAIQNCHSLGQDLYAQLPCEIDGSYPLNIQCCNTVASANQQFLTENRSNRIQEMHARTELDFNEFSWPQISYPSVQQFGERNMNHLEGHDTVTMDLSWNGPNASHMTCPLSHQLQQNVSNIGQAAHSTSHEAFGNKLSDLQAGDTSDYFHDSGVASGSQDSPLQPFQHSVGRSEDIHSQYPQGLRQSGSDPNISQMHSSSYSAPGIHFNQDCGLYPPTRELQNKSIANQDLHLLNRKTPYIHQVFAYRPLPPTLARNLNKRHLLNSHFGQQFKRGSCPFPHVETQPSTSDNYLPLPINEKQNLYSDQGPSADGSRKENGQLRLSQLLDENPSEFINIFVFGPPISSKCLLETLAGADGLNFFPPYSLAYVRTITRCEILMKVSVWKIDELSKSNRILRSSLYKRSAIIFVLSFMNKAELSNLEKQICSVRKDINPNIPMILVKRKPEKPTSDKRKGDVTKGMAYKGFKLKAKYNLSAYLECSFDSREDTEAAMFTAIDVSFLCKF